MKNNLIKLLTKIQPLPFSKKDNNKYAVDNIDKLTVKEIKDGYRFDAETNSHICNTCKKVFEIGEIFSFDNRLFEAARAIKIHVDTESL